MNVRAELDTFIHRICSLRSVTLLVAWSCMLDITLCAFRDEAAALGVKDTFVVLPFVQTDMYFSKVILLGVLCFYSNAPFMEKGGMYAVLRTGRNRWGRRNIRYIFFSSFFLSLCLAFLSSLTIAPAATWSNAWGTVYHTLSVTGSTIGAYISGKTLTAFAPFELLAHIIAIDSLVFACIGMLLYVLGLYLPRIWGYLITIVIAFLPTMEWMPYDIQYISPCSWMYPSQWRYGQDIDYPSLTYIYTALFLLLLLLGWAGQAKISRAAWGNQEET